MLIEGRRLPHGEKIETDVCIVGAGPMGITLGLEFIEAPFRVALVESGGLKLSHKTQWLYRGENIGRPYFDLEYTKQRYFGGASNKWFGRCRPLDAIDFEERSWVPYSGWPFGKDELEPYYARAHHVCQLGLYNYDPAYWESETKRSFPLHEKEIETKIFQFSPPTRFRDQYLHTVEKADNIKTFLNANAVFISLSPNGKKVDSIKFSTLGGKTFHVVAKKFILAASALENTRLLLVSNDARPNGIGNENDLVGRFFMEHPHIFIGALIPKLSEPYVDYYKTLTYNERACNLGTVATLGFTEA